MKRITHARTFPAFSALFPAALEAVFFLLLFLLIFCMSRSDRTVTINLDQTAGQVLSEMKSDSLEEENSLKLRDRFGLSEADYESAVYYGPVSNMDVEELLIIKLSDASDSGAVKEAFEQRIAYQETNFDGYGTDQMAILKNAKILIKGGYAALIISEHADEAYLTYTNCLKGGI